MTWRSTRSVFLVLCLCPAGAVLATDHHRDNTVAPSSPLIGRWEGSVRLPGEALRMIVDLDRSAAAGWLGSIILPTLNVKGAPLSEITSDASWVHFILPTVFGGAPDGPASFEGTLQGQGLLTGTFVQGGHHAPFSLHRTGPAQVELPPSSTPIDASLAGVWKGDYEMGGYVRHVTLELAAPAGATATAKFEVVGKQAHSLAVDLIREDEGLVRIESHEFGIAFEGRLQQPDELRGSIEQNAAEAPIMMKRMLSGIQ